MEALGEVPSTGLGRRVPVVIVGTGCKVARPPAKFIILARRSSSVVARMACWSLNPLASASSLAAARSSMFQ